MTSGSNQQKHRHSIRLKGYDYTLPGAYFITVVTHERACLFGEIENNAMHLNEIGKIVEHTWQDLVNHFANIELGTFVIMPNHVHGIVVIKAVDTAKHHGLPDIVREFKSFSARQVNAHLHTPGMPLWQRNYYEHIVRSEHEWDLIHLYITANPANWVEDRENPIMLQSGA